MMNLWRSKNGNHILFNADNIDVMQHLFFSHNIKIDLIYAG